MYRPFIEATERYFNRLLPILVPLQVLIFDLWLRVPWSPYTLHTLPTNVWVCMFVKFQIILSFLRSSLSYADPRIPLVSLLFKKWEGEGGGGSTYSIGVLLWYYDWGSGLLFRGGQLLECGRLFKEIYMVFTFLWTIHCLYLQYKLKSVSS